MINELLARLQSSRRVGGSDEITHSTGNEYTSRPHSPRGIFDRLWYPNGSLDIYVRSKHTFEEFVGTLVNKGHQYTFKAKLDDGLLGITNDSDLENTINAYLKSGMGPDDALHVVGRVFDAAINIYAGN